MSVIEDILKTMRPDLDLKYEELSKDEKVVVENMLDLLTTGKLTLEDFKVRIRDLITAVENELIETPEFDYLFGVFPRENRRHLFLKARLKNYLVLEGLLIAEERAKKAIESYYARRKR